MKSPLLMMNLLSAVYWFDEALQAALKAGGFESVTRAQSLLLANVAAGEHRAIRLARNLGVSRQSVSQMIAELQARELLVVEEDPEDRRARVVKFSSSSTPLREAANSALQQQEKVLRERIGARSYQALKQALLADWGDPPEVRITPDAGAASERGLRRAKG
jgi:DNA-binding MarR family transcriptional regulator